MSEDKDTKTTEKQDNNETLLKTRSILISGEIDKKMAEKVVSQLLLLEAENDDPIKVFIDSPGGDVDSAYAIFDMIRFVKPKVIMVAMGLAASAGALILLAGDKEASRRSPPSGCHRCMPPHPRQQHHHGRDR